MKKVLAEEGELAKVSSPSRNSGNTDNTFQSGRSVYLPALNKARQTHAFRPIVRNAWQLLNIGEVVSEITAGGLGSCTRIVSRGAFQSSLLCSLQE